MDHTLKNNFVTEEPLHKVIVHIRQNHPECDQQFNALQNSEIMEFWSSHHYRRMRPEDMKKLGYLPKVQ